MTVYDVDPGAAEMTSTSEQAGLVVIERRHKTKEGAVLSAEIHITRFEYEGATLTLCLERHPRSQVTATAICNLS